MKIRYFLVRCKNYKGELINFCITRDADKAKSICDDFKHRAATYREISDIKALDILMNDYPCIKSF